MARGNNRRDLDDDAPWLAEAAPRPETRVSRRSLFWTLFIFLALAAIAVIGLIVLVSKKDAGSTQGYMNAEQAPIITAEPGPYKVAPRDPKGLEVEGQDQTLYAAGEGIDAASVIDQSALPEQPLPRPGTVAPAPPPGLPADLVPQASNLPTREEPDLPAPQATTAAPKIAAPKPAPAKPASVAPAAAPAAAPIVIPPPAAPRPAAVKPATPAKKPGTVQLGAFSSEEKANAAWASLAGKHGLSGKRVIAVESGGKTLYRLRAATPDAAATCTKLKAAGDACSAVE